MQVIEQKMAAGWEEEFDIEVEFPKFLGEIVDRTEIIFENFDTETAETHRPKFLIKELACLGR